MNRKEFMKQLEALLQNISSAEQEEALQYYNDYFDDAGTENEQTVIEALGNPARVAENIKRDLYSNGYGDNGFQRATPSDKAVVPYGQEPGKEAAGNAQDAGTNNATYSGQSSQYSGQNSATAENGNKLSAGMIALIVILCVLASPIILSIASGILGIFTGFIASWFALILGFGVAALALIIVFFLLLVGGIACIFSDPLIGVGLIGGGMLCGGLGILFLMLTVAMAGIATPAICSGIAGLVRKLFPKKTLNAAG